MPRSVTTGLYEFDPLMKNPDNRVVNEKQVLAVPARDDFHFLIPQAAPFFGQDVTVRNETTGEQYLLGQDYVLGHRFVEAMTRTGREIYGSIRFLKRDIAGIIVLDYHTLGGEWGYDDQTIVKELSQRSLNPAVRSWEQIEVLPYSFPPVPHDQRVDSLIGFEQVVASIEEIVLAINAKAAGTNLDHMNNRDNPHDVTKQQVGLGWVQNYQIASDAEARVGNRNDRYVTPRGVRLAIEELGLSNIELHKNDKNNPHSVTKTQVGLSNVQNFGIATLGEAQQRQVDNKYMTPALTGVAIQRWYDDTLARLFDGTVENATGVTKAQIGLGSVQNLPLATDAEAVAGTRHDRYMTPLRTFQAIDRFAIIPLNNHIGDRFNPHNVTKAQIGLGKVEDFGVATEQQAREGRAEDVYMTPALTAEAIRNNAGSDLGDHKNNFDNPHNVTKAQVGLSNVENFLIATVQQANEGDSNDTYMTPLRTTQLVTEAVGNRLVAHVNNSANPHDVTKAQVGLGSVQNYQIASKTEAESGFSNARYMTPARTKEAIDHMIGTLATDHMNNQSNPHRVTATQVGLGDVENLPLATKEDAEQGLRHDRYMTPLRVKDAIAAQVSGSIDAHAGDTNNPHKVTKAQVGLSDVDNYPTASEQEAVQGRRNDRFMTPLRVSQMISSLAGQTIEGHVTDTNNPHGVTKDQVGLSNVEDYGIATEEEALGMERADAYLTPAVLAPVMTAFEATLKSTFFESGELPFTITKEMVGLGNVEDYAVATDQEAEEGVVVNKYMTPATTGVALAPLWETLNEFMLRRDNPHKVTKAQVGLSDVDNYPTASEQEAVQGRRNDRFMTPLRTKQAIAEQALKPLNAHLADAGNPHRVTKAQVGLGSVEDYGIATEEEAVSMYRTDAYLTPAVLAPVLVDFEAKLKTAFFESDELPFTLNKAMVGLGNVENYAVASPQEAEEGVVTDKYMTPATTSVAMTALWEATNEFMLRRDNPHQVTLEQLGGITETDLDEALAGKLDLYGTASNASQVFGLSEQDLTAKIVALQSADSELLDGKSYDDILEAVKGVKVENAEKLDGETKAELTNAITADVMSQLFTGQSSSFSVLETEFIGDGRWQPLALVEYTTPFDQPDAPLKSTSLDVYIETGGGTAKFNLSGINGLMTGTTHHTRMVRCLRTNGNFIETDPTDPNKIEFAVTQLDGIQWVVWVKATVFGLGTTVSTMLQVCDLQNSVTLPDEDIPSRSSIPDQNHIYFYSGSADLEFTLNMTFEAAAVELENSAPLAQ